MSENMEKEGGGRSIWGWLLIIFISLLAAVCVGGLATVAGAWFFDLFSH